MTGPQLANFRDLGGHRLPGGELRTGRLMRSAALVDLPPGGARALRALGLRTAVDLREPVEAELDPPDLAGAGARLLSWPLIDGRIDLRAEMSLPDLYGAIIERCGERIAGAVSLLADDGALPAVVFCSAGKDRTGIVTAVLLSALGVDDDAIAEDYARTEAAMQGELRALVERRARAAGLGEQEVAVKLGAPRELILIVLAGVRSSHGGAAGYLAAHGLEPDRLGALRRAVV